MNDTVDKRLAEDARAVRSLRLSERARDQLDARLAMTGQQPDATGKPRPAWLPLAAASAALAAVVTVVLLLPRTPTGIDAPGVAAVAVTVPEPATVRPPMLSVADRVPVEAVSETAPLEDEWAALRNDLERARDQIEADLPLRF